MNKKSLCLSIFLAVVLLLTSCGASTDDNDGKMSVVVTNFAAYDITRQLAADIAGITLLLPPGVEAHTFEPTAQDIVKIQNCDLLVYNGGESEEWVDDILDTLDKKPETFKMTDQVSLLGEDGEEDEYDEHVWTSPVNVMQIAGSLCETLKKLLPEQSEVIHKNYETFVGELVALDGEYRAYFSANPDALLVFADRFPFKYLARDYGFKYMAAFPGCSTETEPDAKTISELISAIEDKGIDRVFTIEFSNQNIAKAISESTGVKIRTVNSCHNVTKEQLSDGVTYISLMRDNLSALQD